MLRVGPNTQFRNMFSCAILLLRSSHYNQLVLDQSRNCAPCQPCMYNLYWTNRAIARYVSRACTESFITTDVSDQSRNCAALLIDTLLCFWYLHCHAINMYWTKRATVQNCSSTSYITLRSTRPSATQRLGIWPNAQLRNTFTSLLVSVQSICTWPNAQLRRVAVVLITLHCNQRGHLLPNY